MKIAIVCDDLIQNGGQETLVISLCSHLHPHALYTSMATDSWVNKCKELNIPLKTSFMQKLPFKEKLYKFYALFFLYILAFESFVLDEFDVVISVSSRFAHGIITRPGVRHIAYINSPGRMFWEPHTYFQKISLLKILWPVLSWFRIWDKTALHRVDTLIANSRVPFNRIKKYHHKTPNQIISPFFRSSKTAFNIKPLLNRSYYVVISRLTKWKRLDIVIDAFKRMGLNLVVIGTGDDTSRLRELSAHTLSIKFMGWVSDEDKYSILSGAKALIFPQYEDFGITPLEALAHGVPVIGYGKGGITETVLPGKTGVFFYDQTSNALIEAIQSFNEYDFDPHECIYSVSAFTEDVFIQKIKSVLYN